LNKEEKKTVKNSSSEGPSELRCSPWLSFWTLLY